MPPLPPSLETPTPVVLFCPELRDETRAAVLAHLRNGMDRQARQGLVFTLKVGLDAME